MFERFTERARQVIVLAQAEAHELKHKALDTEHLLLGLLREEQGVAARTLEQLGVTIDAVREQVCRINPFGEEESTGQIPLTDDAKQVLELSLRQALSLGHNYIGTEHLLLGLVVQDRDTAAKRILVEFGTDPKKVEQGVRNVLAGKPADAETMAEVPALAKKPNLGAMSANELKWLIVAATTELARRANISS